MIFAGLALGVALAAQLGPVSLLIVRSVLRGGRAIAVGLAMAGAVALVDVLYATVGLAGAGRLLDAGGLRAGLGLVSGAILVAVAARRVGRRLMAAVDVAIGAGLVVFGGVLGYRAAES
jgi:hypothetical protein